MGAVKDGSSSLTEWYERWSFEIGARRCRSRRLRRSRAGLAPYLDFIEARSGTGKLLHWFRYAVPWRANTASSRLASVGGQRGCSKTSCPDPTEVHGSKPASLIPGLRSAQPAAASAIPALFYWLTKVPKLAFAPCMRCSPKWNAPMPPFSIWGIAFRRSRSLRARESIWLPAPSRQPRYRRLFDNPQIIVDTAAHQLRQSGRTDCYPIDRTLQ